MDARQTPENPMRQVFPADADGLRRAAAVLSAGGIAALPTETVYGLAARAMDKDAVATIFAAKGRPAHNPLIVHVANLAQAEQFAHFDAAARALATAFWPGPLTLVLPLRADVGLAPAITAGHATVALRVPAHPVMQAMIEAVGPLAAPSANRSGHISPTCAAHVVASLGAVVPVVLDAGACAQGLESTILQVTNGAVHLLRPGALAAERIAAFTGPLVRTEANETGSAGSIAPGMMASHYAPRQPVRLDAMRAGADEFHIGFGAVEGDLNLSPAADLAEAAAGLFDALHQAEASGRTSIAVAPLPHQGLGHAINDRLMRAAAERQ